VGGNTYSSSVLFANGWIFLVNNEGNLQDVHNLIVILEKCYITSNIKSRATEMEEKL
jgi:hypothetical protein